MTAGWTRRKDERPGEILAAAKTVFAEQGAGASLNEIARRAGVSKGTIYLYFYGKADLYQKAIGGTAETMAALKCRCRMPLSEQIGLLQSELKAWRATIKITGKHAFQIFGSFDRVLAAGGDVDAAGALGKD